MDDIDAIPSFWLSIATFFPLILFRGIFFVIIFFLKKNVCSVQENYAKGKLAEAGLI